MVHSNLRRNNSLFVPFIGKEIFSKSFFPKTIREWNNVSDEIKRSNSVNSFKTKLHVTSIYGPSDVNKFFAYGHGYSTINHCRMHLGLIHLRSHLFNYNLVSTPYCENKAFDHVLETSNFLLSCLRYSDKRHTVQQL